MRALIGGRCLHHLIGRVDQSLIEPLVVTMVCLEVIHHMVIHLIILDLASVVSKIKE